ncbi:MULTISPECIES: lysophospholipid acyltransferase family protein [Rhodanobacter]|uniref:1-acyl-sn-glycerol-3-phosphate acyltransferase n=1 Tax=Rhodanobacter hydrolyticus TaxID=2250595 RepID=A0ABW8J8P6_9GAMM|nr:lysophospholipid acyltransferase family protein [Rhodanobacter sp. 7MK24]MBD8880070.1 1-acyl-sn-glycerol-3-phosphate acyltransferase [Rhodanobacter sp. 7MK24]
MLEPLVARSLTGFIRLLTGSRVFWSEQLAPGPRVYYGNHSSHGDFVLIWSALPPALRAQARPVAAAEYWRRGALRRYLIRRVFKGVLVERDAAQRTEDPITTMTAAIEAGDALILFPEGTRNPGEGLLPFKSGLYHLATRCADLELVPVWLENLNRVMPKGRLIPLPLLCTARFGMPLRLAAGEDKQGFLERTRTALLALAPKEA